MDVFIANINFWPFVLPHFPSDIVPRYFSAKYFRIAGGQPPKQQVAPKPDRHPVGKMPATSEKK